VLQVSQDCLGHQDVQGLKVSQGKLVPVDQVSLVQQDPKVLVACLVIQEFQVFEEHPEDLGLKA